uniref:ShKT domain-containing protein n=1 Tax=Alexandrium catenella TaxID=2925 RepID=A0A7S1WDX9_ALECA
MPAPTLAPPAPSGPPAPTPAPTSSPTPQPVLRLTPAPTPQPPSGCYENGSEQKVIQVGSWKFRGVCASYDQHHLCGYDPVKAACPITCRKCSKPGCEDDGDFTVQTTYGTLKCVDWKRYTHCWKSVEAWCPTSCRADSCTR